MHWTCSPRSGTVERCLHFHLAGWARCILSPAARSAGNETWLAENIPRHKKNVNAELLIFSAKIKEQSQISQHFMGEFTHFWLIFPLKNGEFSTCGGVTTENHVVNLWQSWIPRCPTKIPMVCSPKDLDLSSFMKLIKVFYHVLFLIKSWILACPRWTKKESENWIG